jgi:hypothetical protein
MVSLITYGDDVKGSVSAKIPEYNHITVADYLSKHDMKFTMPDKESEATEYMIDEEADLLKRKNIYNKDLGMFVGALSEDSIFKSLHSVLKSKELTPDHQAAINIDGALREWFFHGEELYERRRAEMKRVAEKADIVWMCRELDTTYAERLEQHCERYNLKTINQKLDTQGEERPLNPDAIEYVPKKDFSSWDYKRLVQTREAMMKLVDRYPEAARHKVKLSALESELAKRTVPVGCENLLTEADQLRRADVIFTENEFTCYGKNLVPFVLSFGEIDALYYRCVDGMNVYALVEAKLTRNCRQKARKQLIKYGKVLALLQPNAHIRTYIMVGLELSFVGTFGAELDYEFEEVLS